MAIPPTVIGLIEGMFQLMEVVTMVIQLYLLSEYVDRSVVAGGRRHRCDDYRAKTGRAWILVPGKTDVFC